MHTPAPRSVPSRSRFATFFGLLAAVVAMGAFLNVGAALAATSTWTQTDWSGGADGGSGAVHPTDDTGWTKYSSASGVSATASPGNVVLSTTSATATDDGIFTTTGSASGGGFANGATSSTIVSGSGAAAGVELTANSTTASNLFDTVLSGAPAAIGSNSSMLRGGSEDAIYVLQGSGTGFFKYSIAGNSWTTLTVVPATVGTGALMMRNGTDDDIYVLQGGGTGFYKYSISGNSWTTLTVAPGTVGAGASMLRNGSDDDIYLLQGGATTGFFKYSITGNSWTTLTVVPAAVSTGGQMIRNGSDDTIYVLRGNSSTAFYSYSILGNSWTTLTVVPSTVSSAAKMIRNGSADEIYLMKGGNTTAFYKYSISGDSWTTLAVIPATVTTGGQMIWNGTDDSIYVLRGNSSNSFFKYSITGNAWTTLTSITNATTVGSGSQMIRNDSEDAIYVLQGNSTTGFHAYSIAGNTWRGTGTTSLAAAPAAVGTGSVMLRNGSDEYAYVLRGGGQADFYRYSFATGSWTTLASAPATISTGAVMLRNGNDDVMYVFRGNGTSDVYKYTISSNAWTTLASLPAALGSNGPSVFRKGGDDAIYVLRGSSTDFFKYSISGNAWTTLTAVPATVGSGGSLIQNTSGDDIYVAIGASTAFYKYSIAGNSWTALTSAPNTLFSPSTWHTDGEDAIYFVRGSATTTFYKYSISGNAWTTLAVSPIGMNVPILIRNGTDDDIYFLRGNSSTNFFKYSILNNAFTTLTSVPGTVSSGFGMIRNAADNQIYILQGNSTTSLWRYNINTATYPASGTFTSAVIDTGSASVFGNLSWSSTVPSGTTLTLATRTGPVSVPDGSWSAWSAELSDSAGSAITSPSARYIQYRGTLGTSASANTPNLNDVSIAYGAYQSSGELVSSSFDSTVATNVLSGLAWTEDAALPAGTTVTVSLRTASSSSGLTGAWTDFTDATTDCSKSTGTVTCTASAIPAGMKSGGDDRYFQYKIALTTSDSGLTPTVGSAVVSFGASSSGGSNGGTITVIKQVINDDGGTRTVSDFPLFVNGTPVVSGEPHAFPAPAPVYTVTETGDAGYARTFSGDCDANGQLNLNSNDNKVCIVTNDDLAVGAAPSPATPVIRVTKIPDPQTLPSGGGTVTYTETIINPGTVALSDVHLTDDRCAPVQYVSGDMNGDSKLDVSEAWIYTCRMTLAATTTNTAVATGEAGGMTVSDAATVTVIVIETPAPYGVAEALASAPTINADKGLSVPSAGPAPLCVSGTLMKLASDGNPATTGDAAVYYCGADGKRYVFPNAGTYFSWYKDFSDVRIVSGPALAATPLGGIVTYRPGSRMLKFATDPRTYAVAKGGVLRWIMDEAVARALYGAGWNELISDLPVELFDGGYSIGDAIGMSEVIPSPPVAACSTATTFTQYLAFGSTASQVLPLQRLLQCLDDFPADIAPTGYFGSVTQDAVKRFQTANGISPVGYVGPMTREALNRYASP